MEKFKSLLYTILHGESLILEGCAQHFSKIGGGQRKLWGRQPWKTGAIVWQWVATFKEAVPPPPPTPPTHPPTSAGLFPSRPELLSELLPVLNIEIEINERVIIAPVIGAKTKKNERAEK